MPTTVEIDFEDGGSIATNLTRRDGDIVGDLLRRAERMADRARQLVPTSSGALRDSITVEQPRDTAGRFTPGWDVIAEAPHAVFVHEGRRAGARMPPSGVLLEWMERAGIPEEAEFVVRRKIGRDGIEAIPFLIIAAQEELP